MRLPAAAVLRYVSWACPGRTNAKKKKKKKKDNPRVQAWMTTAVSDFNFFRSKTDLVYRHEWLCRSGNGHGGSILTPQQAEDKNCRSVGTCSTWKMQSWLENTSVVFLYNVYRTAVTFSVQIICLRKNLNAPRPSELVRGRLHSTVSMARCGLRDAFVVWLCKSGTIEDHVLYYAKVVSRYAT